MRHGIVLFASDRGITPAEAARAAEAAGFDTFYVPEHTHIPVRREAPHPGTKDGSLPDDRYTRTLDPWVALATAAQVTTRIGLATAVALPVESDPITLAKTIATLDHLSGGRVTLGAGFGWNTDELNDHNVPAAHRRTVLREYVEAMRALWTEEVASYQGKYVSFGPSWAYPKPARSHVPIVIGAGGGPRTFEWIARNADGWMTTPTETDLLARADALRAAWADAGRAGAPQIHALATARPTPELLAAWDAAGVTDAIWGLPDKPADEVLAFIDRHAGRLGVAPQSAAEVNNKNPF
jgi:probable F420-dependent oxidoreductase